MSATPAKALDIAIMGRTYKVSCQDEERESLLEARARGNAPQIGPDGFDMTEAKRRMASMRVALDQALAPQEKLL
jgi:hypothetical protein